MNDDARAAQGWQVLADAPVAPTGSCLMISAPTWLCRPLRARHMWPFLGPRPSTGLPVLESPGPAALAQGALPIVPWACQLAATLLKCHAQGQQDKCQPFPPRHLSQTQRAPLSHSQGPQGSMFPSHSVTFALSRRHLTDTREQGAKDFYFKIPEQKTACACLVVASL